MVNRVFRLSISPERAPEVCRVIDFDGRATLHDVHNAIQHELVLDDDHLYAFYLSGKYFDRSSEHSLSRDSRHDSQRSALFRLKLDVGRRFAYLFDFGDEHRHSVTVVSITDVEEPLSKPVLVESVGKAPSQYGDYDGEDEPYELPEYLTEVAPLAEAVLELSEQLDPLYEEDDAKHALTSEEGDESTEEDDAEATTEGEPAGPPEAIRLLLVELSKAVLALAVALEEDEEALRELDAWSQRRELLPRLAEVPLGLVSVGEFDSALAVARALTFGAVESFSGDIAIILAESGKRDEAVSQLEANLKQFPDSFQTAIKSGAAYEALGDAAAAEASYRRAMTLAEDETEDEEAVSQLTGLLEDMGRFEELDELLSPTLDSEPRVDAKAPLAAQPLPPVGRNDPCPCGSGKKYKKCHAN